MNPTRLALLVLLALALLAAGCGASAVAAVEGRKFGPAPGYSRADDGDADGGDGDGGGDQDGDDDDDEDGGGDDDDDQDGGDDDDDDQDGGDDDDDQDDDDATACEGYELRVTNDGVTAARVAINGDELVAPNDFPTTDTLVSGFTAVDGENAIRVWLAGSPGDQLSIEIAGPEGIVLAADVTRDGGQPEEAFLTLTAACGG